MKSFAVLKPGGRAAFIASGHKAPEPPRSDVQSLRPPVPRTRAAMERVADLFGKGAVRAPEIKLYKLSQAADAHRVSQGRHFGRRTGAANTEDACFFTPPSISLDGSKPRLL